MNAIVLRSIFAAAALCGSIAVAAEPEAPVKVNVDALPAHVAVQVRAHASQGLKPLRDYLERTRFIHQLRIEDVIVKGNPAQVAKQEIAEPKKEDTLTAKVDAR